jgi:CheY-like chemotaxis protein
MFEIQTAPSNTNDCRKHRLLVAENNPALRDFLLAILRAEGYVVVGVATWIDLMDTLAVSLHPISDLGRSIS